jgi:hypothetical protein
MGTLWMIHLIQLAYTILNMMGSEGIFKTLSNPILAAPFLCLVYLFIHCFSLAGI